LERNTAITIRKKYSVKIPTGMKKWVYTETPKIPTREPWNSIEAFPLLALSTSLAIRPLQSKFNPQSIYKLASGHVELTYTR
jgi:hypothetical protein